MIINLCFLRLSTQTGEQKKAVTYEYKNLPLTMI